MATTNRRERAGSDISPLGTDIGPLGTDIGPLGTDIGPLGTDIGPLGTDVSPLRLDVIAVTPRRALVQRWSATLGHGRVPPADHSL